MDKAIGENDRMQISVKHYPHQGMFTLALGDEMDREIRRKLLMHMGVTAPGTLESYSHNDLDFFGYLQGAMIVNEEKETKWSGSGYTTRVKSRDATQLRDAAAAQNYVNIVNMCNRWMGLDDNTGLKTDTKAVEAKQESDVHEWCKKNNLEFLVPILDENGFDEFDDVKHITIDDLQKMGVDKLGHQNRVMRAIESLK